MKKFLLPVDFSSYSEKAIDAALLLAEGDAEIILLNVYLDPLLDADPGTDIPPVITDYTEKVIHRMETDAETQLEALAEKVRIRLLDLGRPTVLVSHSLRRGIAEDVIEMHADEADVDMIVMGTRGMNSTTRAIFGSVTASVIAGAHKPVFAIPEGSNPHEINKIMYATNFDKADLDALSKLLMIFRNRQVSIHCVHFCVETYAKDVEVLMNDLHEQLRSGAGANVNFDLVECESLEEGMEEYMKNHDIDMLAMTTHKRGFFARLFTTSHTKKMLYHTHTPLLAFHA